MRKKTKLLLEITELMNEIRYGLKKVKTDDDKAQLVLKLQELQDLARDLGKEIDS